MGTLGDRATSSQGQQGDAAASKSLLASSQFLTQDSPRCVGPCKPSIAGLCASRALILCIADPQLGYFILEETVRLQSLMEGVDKYRQIHTARKKFRQPLHFTGF